MANNETLELIYMRANGRCEWTYLDGARCRNVLSLQQHHKTYFRYGKEIPEDLSLLCPSHHIMADILRKEAIGQRDDIIIEWLTDVYESKFSKMNAVTTQLFYSRLTREEDRFHFDYQLAVKTIEDLSQSINYRRHCLAWINKVFSLVVDQRPEHIQRLNGLLPFQGALW